MVYLKREVCPVSASLLFPISGRAALALDPSAGSEQPQPDQTLPWPTYQLGGMLDVFGFTGPWPDVAQAQELVVSFGSSGPAAGAWEAGDDPGPALLWRFLQLNELLYRAGKLL